MKASRLRPHYSEAELAELYAHPYDHSQWVDHRARVLATVAIGWAMIPATGPSWEGADLSCGDATIARNFSFNRLHLGDITPGWWEYTGPIEQTLDEIPSGLDMFICTETIEHLDHPIDVICRIGGLSRRLILSTPIDAWRDSNPEHYWAWDREYVEWMLLQAGYGIHVYGELDCRPGNPGSYRFGIWGCVK